MEHGRCPGKLFRGFSIRYRSKIVLRRGVKNEKEIGIITYGCSS